MNWILRNLAVVVFGAATSVAAVAVLLYLEAGNGQPLFSYALFTYVPLGAIGAGLLGATGYVVAALALRARPARAILLVILAIAAGVVYMAQSAELGLMFAGKDAPKSLGAFGGFLANSVTHSQVQWWSAGSGGDSDSGSASAAPRSSQQLSGGGSDGAVAGIGSGVSGMMATEDVNHSAAGQKMTQMDANITSIGSGMKNHAGQWAITLGQVFGFAIGAFVAIGFVRGRLYCSQCMLLLSKKGAQTRYFNRSQDMQSATDDVLTKARERQLRESIQAHTGRGYDKAGTLTEYASTIEVRMCKRCQTHRVNFSARRKAGSSWKDIALLGYSVSSLEPVDLA